ncbi:hypothetical protein ACIA8E_12330 [Streptomyces sp. NPDC051664]|uniref:hypothetical protein n=1 Tax=Streptomyces sp. NPDC051664 TaxID=3365668 RepID=UPI0037BD2A9A
MHRLRDAAAAGDGARAVLEPAAVPAVRAGAEAGTVAEPAGLVPYDLLRMETT